MDRRTRETWSQRVDDWKASGLTAAAYASRHRINETTLKWWKWHLGSKTRPKAKAKAPATVSPLTFVEMSIGRSDALELVLPDGITVRVPAGFDAVALGRLLDLLEKRR